jgi:hypothetical protein
MPGVTRRASDQLDVDPGGVDPVAMTAGKAFARPAPASPGPWPREQVDVDAVRCEHHRRVLLRFDAAGPGATNTTSAADVSARSAADPRRVHAGVCRIVVDAVVRRATHPSAWP